MLITQRKFATYAERFQKKVEDYIVEGEETQPGGKLTVSMGISLLFRDKTLNDLIREANKGLYESKPCALLKYEV